MGRRKTTTKRKRAAAAPVPDEGATGGIPPSANPPGVVSDGPPAKRVKTFDERWKTATKTAEQVLGMYFPG